MSIDTLLEFRKVYPHQSPYDSCLAFISHQKNKIDNLTAKIKAQNKLLESGVVIASEDYINLTKGDFIMSDIVSEQLQKDIENFVKDSHLVLEDIFDIGRLQDLKIQFHFSSEMNPRSSTKVSMHKHKEFYIENGKIIDKKTGS